MAAGAQAQSRWTLSMFMIVLAVSIPFVVTGVDPLLLSLNLPAITQDLDIPSDLVGFTGSVATLVMAAAVLGVGNLGDLYGHKRLLMYGLIGNIVFQLLTAFSPNYQFLIVMRILDGLALTALLGLSLALLTASMSAAMRPTAIGLFLAVYGIFTGITPLISGLLVSSFGWRSSFLICPVFSIAAIILISRFVPDPSAHNPERKLDVGGILLFGISLLGLVYGIGQIQNGLTDPGTWIPLALGVLALLAFVPWERRQQEPALDLALFLLPTFVIAILADAVLNFYSGGFGVLLGQFGTSVLGLSESATGLIMIPSAFAGAVGSIVAGRLIPKYTNRVVMIVGLLILAASSITMSFASPTMPIWLLTLAYILVACGNASTQTSSSDVILGSAPPDRVGAVSAMKPAAGMTGYTLGPTIFILLLNVFFSRAWLEDAGARGLTDQQAQNALDVVTQVAANSSPVVPYNPYLVQQTVEVARADYSTGVMITMLIITVVPLVVAALAYFLVPRHRQQTPEVTVAGAQETGQPGPAP
jgi:DHA2 family multidrug resistance protein-like MFS transporter